MPELIEHVRAFIADPSEQTYTPLRDKMVNYSPEERTESLSRIKRLASSHLYQYTEDWHKWYGELEKSVQKMNAASTMPQAAQASSTTSTTTFAKPRQPAQASSTTSTTTSTTTPAKSRQPAQAAVAAVTLPTTYPANRNTATLSNPMEIMQYAQELIQRDIIPATQNKQLPTNGSNTYNKLDAIIDDIKFKPHDHLSVKLAALDDKLRNLYTVAEFLRSFIDFHHDFKHLARDMIEPTKEAFEQTILPRMQKQMVYVKGKSIPIELKKWYEGWMGKLERVGEGLYTRDRSGSGRLGVDPHRCYSLMKDLVEEFVQLIRDEKNVGPHGVVDWIPETLALAENKTCITHNSGVAMASMNGDDDDEYADEQDDAKAAAAEDKVYNFNNLKVFRKYLNSLKITHCFWESCGSHVYSKLIQKDPTNAEDKDIRNRPMPLAKWDGLAKYNKTIDARNTIPVQSSTLSLFGGVFTVEADMGELNAQWKRDTNNTIQINIKGQQPLGLNRLLKVCGEQPIRISRKKGDIQDINNINNITIDEDPATRDNGLYYVPLLKTWTDFVQVHTLLEARKDDKRITAMCTVDKFCMLTAYMYGLPFVIQGNKTNMILYNFDTVAVEARFNQDKEARAATLAFVLDNLDGWKKYVDGWFDSITRWIDKFTDRIKTDPSVYLSMLQFKNTLFTEKDRMQHEWLLYDQIKLDMVNHKDHVKQLLLNFPTSISEWFHHITQSTQLSTQLQAEYDKMRLIMKSLQDATTNIDLWRVAYLNLKETVQSALPNQDIVPDMVKFIQRAYKSISVDKIRILMDEFFKRLLEVMKKPSGAKGYIISAVAKEEWFRDIIFPNRSIKYATSTNTETPVKSRSTRSNPISLPGWDEYIRLFHYTRTSIKAQNSISQSYSQEMIAANVLEVYHILLQCPEFAEYIQVLLYVGHYMLSETDIKNIQPTTKENAINFIKGRFGETIEARQVPTQPICALYYKSGADYTLHKCSEDSRTTYTTTTEAQLEEWRNAAKDTTFDEIPKGSPAFQKTQITTPSTSSTSRSSTPVPSSTLRSSTPVASSVLQPSRALQFSASRSSTPVSFSASRSSTPLFLSPRPPAGNQNTTKKRKNRNNQNNPTNQVQAFTSPAKTPRTNKRGGSRTLRKRHPKRSTRRLLRQ